MTGFELDVLCDIEKHIEQIAEQLKETNRLLAAIMIGRQAPINGKIGRPAPDTSATVRSTALDGTVREMVIG